MDAILGTLDVARRLGVSEPTVRRFADTGQLPAAKTQNGRRLFSSSDVEAFAKARENSREFKR